MYSLALLFQLIGCPTQQMRLELPCTPPGAYTGPAISIQTDAKSLAILNRLWLLLGFVKHELLKPFGVTEDGNMESTFPEQMLIHPLNMLIHFRELHARIGKHYRIQGITALQEQQEHGG